MKETIEKQNTKPFRHEREVSYHFSTKEEIALREKLFHLFKTSPIPGNQILSNLGMYIPRQLMARMIFMHEMYQKILNVQGIAVELGCRWGQNIALFESFRGIYEPYNYTRRIVGFDTFSGFPVVDSEDGKAEIASVGACSVTEDYDHYLNGLMECHEQLSPISHIKKFQIIKGDASRTVEQYLNDNPQTIIALIYFDVDLYTPTKKCLQLIKRHLTKGSIIGFDQLNWPDLPGETLAYKEVFELDRYRIVRSPICPNPSYVIIE